MNNQPKSILDKIKSIEQTNYNRLKCSWYGEAGTGKTRISCTFPKPLILIASEVGTDSIGNIPGIDLFPLANTEDIFPLIDHIVSGKSSWSQLDSGWKQHRDSNGRLLFIGDKYRSSVLDTATKMKKTRTIELFSALGKEMPVKTPLPQYANKEWKDVWTQCSSDMQKMLGALLSVSDNYDICTVVNSHEANMTYDDGSTTSSDFLKPNISSDIGKAVSNFLNAEVSYMGQMLIRDKFEEREEKQGDISLPIRVKVGSEYVMRIGPDAVYRTKFRRPLSVTKPLPDFLANPSYDLIVKIIKGEY